MNDEDYVLSRIRLLRPQAKFVAYNHSEEFIAAEAELGEGFHYVNLYDEQIDSNVIHSPRGLIMVHNTYLASFAYNLFLCWLLSARSAAETEAVPSLALLLKHNFKKYFAEQLLHYHNNIFARAIFLETLLYEQHCMVPVFAAKSRHEDLSTQADFGAQMMSSLVANHELGHYFLDRAPLTWNEILNLYGGTINAQFNHVLSTYPPAFVEEYKCDAMAVILCMQRNETEMPRLFCLRAIAFAFASFAVLSSLTKSAAYTSTQQQEIADQVDFGSIVKKNRDYTYAVGTDLDLVERARLVIEVCQLLAQRDGSTLFEEAGTFPLPATIVDDLLMYVSQVMESDDANARTMSLLVAEAFHEHPRGLEFLYLRSKTFTGQNLDEPDVIRHVQ